MCSNLQSTDHGPIDAVITWVDGNDPRHKAKLQKYGNTRILNTDDVAGETRFASIGEIFYCIASLNRFAPWLNKIYIVTDEQDPQICPFIARHFPRKSIPMEIIDHKTIFRGFEQHLPTFNSISIESMTWRIPGLSEKYIEFNDDLILTAPTTPSDFFTPDGKVICYGTPYSSLLVRLSRMFKYRKNGTKKVTYKETMLNAASILGKRHSFIKLYHTPKPLLKSVYEKYFTQHPEILEENIRHRFRYHKQFNPQELQYIYLKSAGQCHLLPAYDNLLYFYPKKRTGYITAKLESFTRKTAHKFGCFNSIDLASQDEQKQITDWIKQRIGIEE